MENKKQEALDLLKNLRFFVDERDNLVKIIPMQKCSPMALINMIFKSITILQKTIDENKIYKKTLDKSLDMYFRKGTYIFPNKESLKKYLLNQAKEELYDN